MNKKLLGVFIVVIIAAGGAFYGGMKYQESKTPLAGFSLEQRQQVLPEGREGTLQRGIRGETGAIFLSGEVIARDEQSITLKMPDGSSRIVFFSDSTEISKTTEGAINDIEIGKQIVISGVQNADGSYTASIIQLFPHYLFPRNNE